MPNEITVPVGVEAVWVLIRKKDAQIKSQIYNIVICSYYYAGPKATPKKLLFDHMAEILEFLSAKYGPKVDFVLSADSNRLSLEPILQLSPRLAQVVTVPTRLNPPATLDTIITTLHPFYRPPYTIPPLRNNENNPNGHPSDHQIVIWEPLSSIQQIPERQYKIVTFRPMPDFSVAKFGLWLQDQSWMELYKSNDVNYKANFLQQTLLNKYYELFPLKTFKVSPDDKPWFTKSLKELDRKRKREFRKNQKSLKWRVLNENFLGELRREKERYRQRVVDDLRTSKPGQW